MDRRNFFRSEPLAGVLLPDIPDLTAAVAAPGDLSLIRVTRRAMATTFEIAIPFGTPNALQAAEEALDQIDELEDQLTVYRDLSEVSQLNATAGREPVVVEQNLFDLLTHAATLTQETQGAFDIGTGALIKAWGFYKREGCIPPAAQLQQARDNSGMRHVVLNAEQRTVKFRRTGLELNLGGIGKGYALDRVADLLQSKWGIRSGLLHGGGSSVRAIGTPPGQLRGWPIAIQHPTNPQQSLGTVWLKHEALGTSAATFQYFVYNNRKYGHLLDPRTGWPAAGTQSASVIAPTAATADALSTAFFVLGISGAKPYCLPRPELAALVLPDEHDHAETVGLPASRYDAPNR